MKMPRFKRSAAVLGLASACIGATVLASAPADAATTATNHFPVYLGHLKLTPFHGDMNTNPAASWSTRTGCPSAFQAGANVAIVVNDADGQPTYHTASVTVPVNGNAPLSGKLNSSMENYLLADGLVPGHKYKVVVRCFDADFDATPVQSTYIKIAADGNSWRVALLP